MPWGYAAAAVGGALISSKGANSAANTQANAQLQAAGTQNKMFQQIQANLAPYMKRSQSATIGLQKLFGTGGSMNKLYQDFQFNPTMKQLQKMPGYQFQLQQGDRALQSSDATTVGALSGPAMKDLMSFNQGLASQYQQQYYNQALSQYQTNQQNYYGGANNIFNRLSSIASLGENAAAQTGNNGTQLGTGISQAQAAAGGSIAAGQVGSANALGGAVSSIPMYYLMAQQNAGGGGTASGPGEGPQP